MNQRCFGPAHLQPEMGWAGNHCWNKLAEGFSANQYGMIVDYLAEFMREMRKRTYADAINKFFKLGRDLNQRDTIAVKRTVSGLLKLLYPNEEYDKEAVKPCGVVWNTRWKSAVA